MKPSDDEHNLERSRRNAMLYGVNDNPPWHLCLLLAAQQFLTCFSGIFSYPIIISSAICIAGDTTGLSELISTVIFVCGISTIIQSTLGVRLPIVQGSSYAFISPIVILMAKYKDKCPDFDSPDNSTLPFEKGSPEHREVWTSNLSEINGSLMVASCFQMIVGFSGLMTLLVRYIGPLTIAPTISLIGLSLFATASRTGQSQWWICFLTMFLVILFSLYLRNVTISICGRGKVKLFMLFPVLFSIVITWMLCLVLTMTDVFPDNPKEWGYLARTDINLDALRNAEWFRFPYPGQWGTPKVTLSGVLSMLAAILASMIESVGDYYACARLCAAPAPPPSAINRGIGTEGITCLLGGLWGAGGGNTSFSQNVGAIGITKVGSRIVMQCVGLIMIILGCLGKFGALFVMCPIPIVGGLYFVTFGMVTAVGISNLQLVDMNSTRNLFIFGFAIFFGMCVPPWVQNNPLDLGNEAVNHVVNVLVGTSMLTGGVMAFVLDNTVPGTLEERGMLFWGIKDKTAESDDSVYDLPFQRSLFNKIKCFRYLPFCPTSSTDSIDNGSDHKEMESVNEYGGNSKDAVEATIPIQVVST